MVVRINIYCLLVLISFPHAAVTQTRHISFTPSDSTFQNPERGFYVVEETGMTIGRITPYQKLDIRSLKKIRKSCTLLFRYFGLKEWRTRDLPLEALQNISDDFAAIRTAGLKCIPRFTYSADIGEPDASLSVILRHIEQLKPILRQNKDIIAVLQAGFIGAWGEWHSSTSGNTSLENRKTILTHLLEAVPPDRMIQVRTPWHKQEVLSIAFGSAGALNRAQAFSHLPAARIGHHNDCFLSDASDAGTYWYHDANDSARGKAYLQLDTRYVPMGGETCRVSEFSVCQTALSEMERMHWSFLNRGYHEGVIAGFTSSGCREEIERRLGYRLVAISAEVNSSIRPAGTMSFRLRLANLGWASPFNRRAVELIVKKKTDDKIFCARLPVDPRFWFAGDTMTIDAQIGIPSAMPHGLYTLYLNMPDPELQLYGKAEYSIRLANNNLWDAKNGWNVLADSLQITTLARSSMYRGGLWFEPASRTTSVSGPDHFSLMQNTPDPFNHSTILSFMIRKGGKITIQVFDAKGKRVAKLFDDVLPSSEMPYAIQWQPTGLTGGTYMIQLRSAPSDGSSVLTDSRVVHFTK